MWILSVSNVFVDILTVHLHGYGHDMLKYLDSISYFCTIFNCKSLGFKPISTYSFESVLCLLLDSLHWYFKVYFCSYYGSFSYNSSSCQKLSLLKYKLEEMPLKLQFNTLICVRKSRSPTYKSKLQRLPLFCSICVEY